MELDLNAIKSYLASVNSAAKKEESGGGFNKNSFFFLPKATEKVIIRFLPPWEGSKIPGKVVFKHWINNSSVYCYKTYGLECQVCNTLSSYKGKLDEKELEPYKSAASSNFNVLVLDDMRDGGVNVDKN